MIIFTQLNKFHSPQAGGDIFHKRKEMHTMARTYTMQDMIEAILKLADMSDTNRKQGDVERANNCTMMAYGEARVLKKQRDDNDFGTYQDDE